MPPRHGGRMPPAHDEGPRPGLAVDPPSQRESRKRVAGRNSITMELSVGRCDRCVVVRRQASAILPPQ
jgi:hypothetical protein